MNLNKLLIENYKKSLLNETLEEAPPGRDSRYPGRNVPTVPTQRPPQLPSEIPGFDRERYENDPYGRWTWEYDGGTLSNPNQFSPKEIWVWNDTVGQWLRRTLRHYEWHNPDGSITHEWVYGEDVNYHQFDNGRVSNKLPHRIWYWDKDAGQFKFNP